MFECLKSLLLKIKFTIFFKIILLFEYYGLHNNLNNVFTFTDFTFTDFTNVSLLKCV